MTELFIVSLVWAFSFGLIKTQLAGLNPVFVAFIRLTFSLLVFLPFIRPGRVPGKTHGALILIGAAQFGLMYITYISSYRYLPAHLVAVFTIFTPIYVTAFSAVLEKRFNPRHLAAALAAVAGAGIILYRPGSTLPAIKGFLLLQLSNLSFAFGQVAYKHLMKPLPGISDRSIFASLYFGAVLLTAGALTLTADPLPETVTPGQWLTLLYLGVIASGLCFFMWNRGAKSVNSGQLSVMNNLKIPLAVAVTFFVFGEEVNLLKLSAGGVLMGIGLFLTQERRPGGRRSVREKRRTLNVMNNAKSQG